VPLGVGLEARQIDHGERRRKAVELAGLGAAQQVLNKDRVPGELTKDSRLDAMLGIGPGEQILHVDVARAGVSQEILQQPLEVFR
jgi:hypothetical protein